MTQIISNRDSTINQMLPNEHTSMPRFILYESMLHSISQSQLHGPPLALSTEVIILATANSLLLV